MSFYGTWHLHYDINATLDRLTLTLLFAHHNPTKSCIKRYARSKGTMQDMSGLFYNHLHLQQLYHWSISHQYQLTNLCGYIYQWSILFLTHIAICRGD